MRYGIAVVGVMVLSASVGCRTTTESNGEDSARAADRPDVVVSSAEVDQASFGALSALEGDWQMAGPDGQPMTTAQFRVSSAGSVVREVMFPGEPHEMTNLYHMDGTDVVCTHYCAAGNQPRMVASGLTHTPEGPAMEFKFDSVSNLRETHDHYMGSLRLVMLDENTIRQEWTSLDREGNPVLPATVFELTRVASE